MSCILIEFECSIVLGWLLFHFFKCKIPFVHVLSRFYLIGGELVRMYSCYNIQFDNMILFRSPSINIFSTREYTVKIIICLNETLNGSSEIKYLSIEFCVTKNITSRKLHLIVNLLQRHNPSGWICCAWEWK